ncbi:MAG TPA: hypothetical protein VLA37_09065 [Sphingomonadaceae bacterium]|nr:hypothetical protein [Sphingomonadaceae bacterium]
MKATIAAIFTAAMIAAPAGAVTGGRIDTLERGTYVCETPGDAASQRGVPVPQAGFEITNASTYQTADGKGTYLRTGDSVRITSGPREGERYRIQSSRMLKQVDGSGSETGLRCVKLGATRS